jgi:hypothetical protein
LYYPYFCSVNRKQVSRLAKQVGVNKLHTQKSGFFKKPDFSTPASFKLNCAYLLSFVALGMGLVSASSLAAMTSEAREQAPQLSQAQPQQWRRMTSQEQARAWEYILNSPLGIAALNQLAIEGFISPGCPKTFYLNQKVGEFQSLLRVKCPNERGVSGARGYGEMRVIFNRFESNIESFQVERVSSEGRPPATKLPD